jgi:ATP-dependent protease ClpP protease subunit
MALVIINVMYDSLAGGGLVAVGQVTTVGEIKTHETVVRTHQSLVDLQVGRAAAKALNVNTPLGGVQVEGLESTVLAGDLNSINVLVATVVTGTGVTLGVLVAHGGAKGIEDSTGSEVLRGNQDNGLTLTLNLVRLDKTRHGSVQCRN